MTFSCVVLSGLLNVSVMFAATVGEPRVTADSVKAEFLYAWRAYKQYAWGHDALKPLSKRPHDWYGTSLYMTPVDAYDAMLIMGLKTEAYEAKKLILVRKMWKD